MRLLLVLQVLPAAGLNQPQMGPVLVPGVLRERDPAPAALTMQTWAGLKEAMDNIGSQVRQVLMVRNDLAMLQEDLRKQEATWLQGEEELEREVAQLQAQSQQLRAEVDQGAVVDAEVKSLEKHIAEEKEKIYTSQQLFGYEAARAQMESGRLQNRADELVKRLEEVKTEGMREVHTSQDAEVEATEKKAALQREAARLKDRVSDEAAALQLEESVARDRRRDLYGSINDTRTETEHLRIQLLPPGQLEAQLAAMKAQVELETQRIAQVQIAKLQATAVCDTRLEPVTKAVTAEAIKYSLREAEMTETCDSAQQRRVLVETIIKEACKPPPATSTTPVPGVDALAPEAPAPAPLPVPAGPAGLA